MFGRPRACRTKKAQDNVLGLFFGLEFEVSAGVLHSIAGFWSPAGVLHSIAGFWSPAGRLLP